MVCIVSYKLLHMSSWMYTQKLYRFGNANLFMFWKKYLLISYLYKELILFEYADSIEHNIIHNAIFD